MARIITVTSGKGGVGKTNLSANLSLYLSKLGYRVCVFDADLGLANINILLGLYPEYTIEDVIINAKPLEDVIIKNYQGIDIIPGSSGVEKIANISDDQTAPLIESFKCLDAYDFLLFDTSAGISKNVVSFCLASSEIIIVITPEPTSLTDAYALLKILYLNGLESTVKIVVNNCKDTTIAKQTYIKFKEVVKKYLSMEIQPLGVILQDSRISEAVKTQKPFVLEYPTAVVTKCINVIAKNLLEQQTDERKAYDIASFWSRCISLFKSTLNLEGLKEGRRATQQEPATKEQHPTPADSDQDTSQPVSPATVPATSPQALSSPQGAVPAAEQSKPTQPEAPYAVDQNLYPLFSKLVDSIASISEEVTTLRKAMESNGTVLPDNLKPKSTATSADEKKSIILDFEKYVQEHSKD